MSKKIEKNITDLFIIGGGINGCGIARDELLSNLVFESFWSCGDLAFWGGFNSVFERDACDDFGEVVKAA